MPGGSGNVAMMGHGLGEGSEMNQERGRVAWTEVRLAGMAHDRIEVSIRRRLRLQNKPGRSGRNVIRAGRHGTVVWRINHCRSLCSPWLANRSVAPEIAASDSFVG